MIGLRSLSVRSDVINRADLIMNCSACAVLTSR
jgi:hypothetical protein